MMSLIRQLFQTGYDSLPFQTTVDYDGTRGGAVVHAVPLFNKFK